MKADTLYTMTALSATKRLKKKSGGGGVGFGCGKREGGIMEQVRSKSPVDGLGRKRRNVAITLDVRVCITISTIQKYLPFLPLPSSGSLFTHCLSSILS